MIKLTIYLIFLLSVSMLFGQFPEPPDNTVNHNMDQSEIDYIKLYPNLTKFANDFLNFIVTIGYEGHLFRKDCKKLNEYLDTIEESKEKQIVLEYFEYYYQNLE